MNDFQKMDHSLYLARRVLGQVAPNPAVGCVIYSAHGRVLGRGATGDGGRPHAEAIALARAGSGARGSTAFVTLEPCAHFGQTPPCAEALIRAGVKRVVVALRDPDLRVNGKGLAMLGAAGVEVSTGVLATEALNLNRGFFLKLQQGRPLVTLKLAQSRDGKTVPGPDKDRWITSVESRRFAHLLRAKHDAILVGVNTVLRDDPDLTCRLPGLENRSPVRVVLDSALRVPLSAKIVRTACVTPTWIFSTSSGGDQLRAAGAEVFTVEDQEGQPALSAVLRILAARGCTRLLVEGGATVWSAFARAGLADRLEIFTGPGVLGPNGTGIVPELSYPRLAAGFALEGRRMIGPDMLESFVARA